MQAHLWHVGVACPVIYQLRRDFFAYISNLLGNHFGRLLFKHYRLFSQELIHVTVLANEPLANI